MYPILALILFAAFHMDAGYLAPGTARIDLETLFKGGEMVIPFGMLVLFLLLKPYVHDPEKEDGRFQKASPSSSGRC